MKLNVIILAGGQSTRFWPLEQKNLYEFFGTPLVVYQIKRYSLFLKRQNFEPKFIIVTNEDNQFLIKKELEKYSLKGAIIITQTLPNQSGAVVAALSKVPKNEKLLIANCNDIFSETLISDLLKKIGQHDLILTAKKVTSYFPGGYLVRDTNGKIEKIWEKPPANMVPNELDLFRFVFDYFSSKDLLEKVFHQSHERLIEYEDALNLVMQQAKTDIVLNDQPFTSLKYPWHILDAIQIFLNTIKESIVKTENIETSAQIVGQVFISEGVKIGSFTKIVGPCYIGKNTVIGDHVLIRHSHIGQNCLIGAHSEVARSYLGDKVMLHRNYIGDSVLETGVSMGANATTANWRFDEQIIKSRIKDEKIDTNLQKLGSIIGQEAKIGVNVSLMPGIKIAKKTVVRPGTIVYKDIKSNEQT